MLNLGAVALVAIVWTGPDVQGQVYVLQTGFETLSACEAREREPVLDVDLVRISGGPVYDAEVACAELVED